MLEEIKEELNSLATEQLKKFNEKLIPNALPIIGVKIPEIRKLAKKICKEDYKLFLSEYDASSFELQMIYAFVISFAKMNFEERILYIEQFLPTIQDWAICDGFVSSLKCISSQLDQFLVFLKKYQDSHNEFEIRFVAVVLMEYYLTDAYVDLSIQMIQSLELRSYYAKMGVAWYISSLMVKYPQKAFDLLEYFKDQELRTLTIRKIRDSYQISKDIKQVVLRYKK